MINFNHRLLDRFLSLNLVKHILTIFALLLSIGVSFAQTSSLSQRNGSSAVCFQLNSVSVNSSYADNSSAIDELDRFFSSIEVSDIDSIIVIGSSSPEGRSSINSAICIKRADALRNFIRSRFALPSHLMHVSTNQNSWPDLLDLITKDPLFPDKNQCLIVLNGSGSPDQRLNQLKFLGYDKAYYYIKNVLYTKLRSASAVVVYHTKPAVVVSQTKPEVVVTADSEIPFDYKSIQSKGLSNNSSALFTIHYPIGSSSVDADYANNSHAIETMSRFFNEVGISRIDSIAVLGSSSPEEHSVLHFTISGQRAEYMKYFLESEFSLPSNLMFLAGTVDTWSHLIRLINDDPNFPDKVATLDALNSNKIDQVEKLKWLVSEGSYNYIRENIFPRLRSSTALVVYYDAERAIGGGSVEDSVAPIIIEPMISNRAKKPLFALKTNLLYDAATILNLSIEVPIGKHFSVAGEFIAPWWLDNKNQNCLQAYNGNIEGKYWFNPHNSKSSKGQFSSMTGWFAGVYLGAGLYDVEYRGKGYQGEFLISAGLMGGYAHSIGSHLRMEYSLGLGYMETNYKSYTRKLSSYDNQWYLYRQATGALKWMGPTHAKVSLVWMLSRNVKL